MNSYRRMFPARPATRPGSPLEDGLIALGKEMKDCDPDEHSSDLPEAGYTYLGQFIDHDVTLDGTPLEHAVPDLDQSTNLRTHFLDLDHLYGGGPRISPHLYDRRSRRGAEKLLIGRTAPAATGTRKSSDDDLPRNLQGVALTADARQDENLIIAQLHVAFLKFHNLMIDMLGGDIASAGPPSATLFAQARRLVTWHYQWIVRHDFLKKILVEEVFHSLAAFEARSAKNPPADPRIPVEFSVAAFRFGHSVVRDIYRYNSDNDIVDLDRLRDRTGFGPPGNVPLPADWVAEWDRFFTIPRRVSHRNRARRIDTQIAKGLHRGMPLRSMFSEVASSARRESLPLPVMTLLRGSRVGLASGQEVAAHLLAQEPTFQVLSTEEIVSGPHKCILTDPRYDFQSNTPLWYYILKEAEKLQKGRCLGPIGSRIVGRVLVGQIATDPASYLRAAPHGWEPPFAETMATLLRKLRDRPHQGG